MLNGSTSVPSFETAKEITAVIQENYKINNKLFKENFSHSSIANSKDRQLETTASNYYTQIVNPFPANKIIHKTTVKIGKDEL